MSVGKSALGHREQLHKIPLKLKLLYATGPRGGSRIFLRRGCTCFFCFFFFCKIPVVLESRPAISGGGGGGGGVGGGGERAHPLHPPFRSAPGSV